ncbi:Helicase POLQ-like [Oopsacas minuta]|uniref:Helicase POLQ-like n=1 Tax=Oopsacas minuta TaxID=111878 RepID=A0AAV7KIP1_9METZ|nr:Helicase POLQ-like [Oopsacas minuta]
MLLPTLLQKVAYASKPELVPIMELSGVGQGRARQLIQAGYISVKEIARTEPLELVNKLKQLNIKQAKQIIASVKLVLQEKAEALREEADELISL